MSAPRVLIMAGGTGGHVYPGLAVAEVLRARGCQVQWLGTAAGLESRVVPAAGIDLQAIAVRGLRRRGLAGWLLAPPRLTGALWQAAAVLRRVRPQVVLGLGGFASGPGGVATWLHGLPLVVHEQNAVPGLTNRLLARLARRVLQAFPASFPPARRALTTGNPLRAGILAVAPLLAPPAATRRLLVLGGSQGARALNELVPAALAAGLGALRVEVLHQCGQMHLQATREAYRAAGVQADVVSFIEDMPAAYAGADLVLCRAGAMTVCEVGAAGRPALFVPYPHAVDDHQSANALHLVRAGAARMLRESELDAPRLAAELRALFETPATLLRMGRAARAWTITDAAERVADVCLEVAHA